MVIYRPTYVEPPAFTPLPYGLFSVVQWVTDGDPHWQAGIQFQPETCETPSTTALYCPNADEPIEKTEEFGVPTVGANDFTVYATLNCSPVGGIFEDSARRTLAALERREHIAVERTFWTGELDNAKVADVVYPHLAADTEVISEVAPGVGEILLQAAADVVVTGAFDLVEGLGLLEQALAECYGGVGVIHAPRKTLIPLADRHVIVQDGDQMRTFGGNLIAFGSGYANTGPDGTPAPEGQAWLYATGQIIGRRSEPRFSSSSAQGLNRSVNTLRLTVERTYTLGWDCCLLAILVDLGG